MSNIETMDCAHKASRTQGFRNDNLHLNANETSVCDNVGFIFSAAEGLTMKTPLL